MGGACAREPQRYRNPVSARCWGAGWQTESAMSLQSANILYTGTFESYQGLDLLLDAFALLHRQLPDAQLLLVGGRPPQVEAYRERARALGIESATTFVGQVHPARIPGFIQAAELIVSPRSSGTTLREDLGYLRSATVVPRSADAYPYADAAGGLTRAAATRGLPPHAAVLQIRACRSLVAAAHNVNA